MIALENQFECVQDQKLHWLDNKTEYSKVAVAWIVFLLMVSRTISLNDCSSEDPYYMTIMRKVCRRLASMPSLTLPQECNDTLEIKRAMRILMFHLIKTEAIPLDKVIVTRLNCITALTSLELWNGINFQWESKKREMSYPIKLVLLWNQCVPLQENIMMQTAILNESIVRQNYTFSLALIQDSPQVAILLLAPIIKLADQASMKQAISRRFVLEYLEIFLQHSSMVTSDIAERVLMMGLIDRDSNLRCMAFKILAKFSSKLDKDSRSRAITLAISNITLNEGSKNVFLSGLRFVNMALIQNAQDGIDTGFDIKQYERIIDVPLICTEPKRCCFRSLEMLIITAITRSDGHMPVQWRQAIYPVIRLSIEILDILFFVRAYHNSSQAMSNLFIDAYGEFLSAKSDAQRHQILLDLACLAACNRGTIERMLHLFTKNLAVRASSTLSAMLVEIIQSTLRHIHEAACAEKLKDPNQLDSSIFLCTLLIDCNRSHSTRNMFKDLPAIILKVVILFIIDSLIMYLAVKIVTRVFTKAFAAERPFRIIRHSLHFLRLHIESRRYCDEYSCNIIEKKLAPLAETLFLNVDCQR